MGAYQLAVLRRDALALAVDDLCLKRIGREEPRLCVRIDRTIRYATMIHP
jgi:hypothetical protein